MKFNTDRQYYRVESGPCFDAMVDWRNRRIAYGEMCFDFAKSVGGTGFYAGNDDNVGNATAISAVTFEGALPPGWIRRRWSSFVVKEGQIPAWPDRRTTAGREALKAIKALPLRPSSYHVCKAINFPGGIRYRRGSECSGVSSLGVWETALIGWSGDTFYIALPRLNDEIANYEAQGYTVETPRWEPLEGMVPVLKEEMELDFARAELREKEAA